MGADVFTSSSGGLVFLDVNNFMSVLVQEQ